MSFQVFRIRPDEKEGVHQRRPQPAAAAAAGLPGHGRDVRGPLEAQGERQESVRFGARAGRVRSEGHQGAPLALPEQPQRHSVQVIIGRGSAARGSGQVPRLHDSAWLLMPLSVPTRVTVAHYILFDLYLSAAAAAVSLSLSAAEGRREFSTVPVPTEVKILT